MPGVLLEICMNDILAKRLAKQTEQLKKYNATGCLSTDLPAVGFIPTGLEVFDKEVLGVGGIPKGKFIEVYGKKSSGKSALTYYMVGAALRQNPDSYAKWYDWEHCHTDAWAKSLGVPTDQLLVVQPTYGEEMADMIQEDIAMGEDGPCTHVIDSLATIIPRSIAGVSLDDFSMKDNYALATFLTRMCNKLDSGFFFPGEDDKGKLPSGAKWYNLSTSGQSIICINHMKTSTKLVNGNPVVEEKSVGGDAMGFHGCVQLKVSRIGFEKSGDITVAQKLKVIADKNKVAPPKKSCELGLSFSGKMEQLGEIDWLTIAKNKGLAVQKGAWISSPVLLPEGRIQGANSFNAYIAAHPEVQAQINAM